MKESKTNKNIRNAENELFDAIDRCYGTLLNYAYEIYKREWCKDRGFDPDEVAKAAKKDREYQGQMYACFDEFEDYEWSDESAMRGLLSNEQFALYKELIYATNHDITTH